MTLLKQTVCGFLGNLCLDKAFRKLLGDSEIIIKIHQMLQFEVSSLRFDWVDSSERELAILINSCFETEPCMILIEGDIITTIDLFLAECKEPKHDKVRARCLLLLSRLCVHQEAALQISKKQGIIVRLFLYFTSQFEDIFENVIRVLHS